MLTAGLIVFAALAGTVLVALFTTYNLRLLARIAGSFESTRDPALCFYLTIDERHFHVIHLVVENAGPGMAHDVAWKTNPPVDSLANHDIETDFLARGTLPQIAPGQRIRSFFGNALEILHRRTPPIAITATCRSSSGHRIEAQFSLEPEQFRGMMSVGDTPENEHIKLMKELNKSAQETMRSMASLSRSMKAISQTLCRSTSPIDFDRKLLGSTPLSPTAGTVLSALALSDNTASLHSVDKILGRFSESEESHVLGLLELLAQDGCLSFERMSRYVQLTPLGRAQARQLDESPESWKHRAALVLDHLRDSYTQTNRWQSGVIASTLSLSERAVQDAIALLSDRGLVEYDAASDGWTLQLTPRGLSELAVR